MIARPSPRPATRIAGAAFLLVAGVGPGRAAPVFPGSSHVGLEPPPGMRVFAEANGFRAGNATISIAKLLPKAFDDSTAYKRALQAPLRQAGVRPFPLPGAPRAYLVAGVQPMGRTGSREWMLVADFAEETVMISASVPEGEATPTDAMIQRAFKTVVMRKRPDLAAEIAALPYVVRDAAGLRVDVVVDRTLQLTDETLVVDLTAKAPHVYVVPIAGPKPGVGLEDFAKGLIRGADASAKILEARRIARDGTEWIRGEALGAESRLGQPAYIVELVRPWPGGDAMRVRGELPSDLPDPAFAARVQAIALSVAPR